MITKSQWAEIAAANPIFTSPGFADATKRWNTLKAEADRMKLSTKEATDFIAFGMTQGKEGRLPKSMETEPLEP